MRDDGQCLGCKDGWTLGKDLDNREQCMCNEILNTQKGYKCETCEQTIPDCKTCQYSLSPDKNPLKAFVGQWNMSHSGIVGKYSNRDQNPIDSQNVICTEPGPNLLVVPDIYSSGSSA